MTRRQAVAAASAGRSWPRWPAARWAWPAPSWPRGGCRSAWRPSFEPHPGLDADWAVLGPGWVLVPLLVLAGSAAAAAGRAGRRRHVWRRSAGRDLGGAARGELPASPGHRDQVRAGARPRPDGRAGAPGPGRRGHRRAGRAGRVHLLRRGLRRRRPSGPVRADLPARRVLRLQRAGLRPGHRPRAAGRRGRPRRHRRRRRPGRRRAVRAVLRGELHLRPGRRQAAVPWSDGGPDAPGAGRDRAGADRPPRTCTRAPGP